MILSLDGHEGPAAGATICEVEIGPQSDPIAVYWKVEAWDSGNTVITTRNVRKFTIS